MFRPISVLLAAVLSLGSITAQLPATVLSALLSSAVLRSQSHLPACCRRNGSHHCSMNTAEKLALTTADPQTSLNAPSSCPFAPQATVASFPIKISLHTLAYSASLLPEQPFVSHQRYSALPARLANALDARGPPLAASHSVAYL